MLSVRVTALEKFRRYMKGVSDYDTEQSLLDTLTGAFKGNDKTRFGTAFHKIIEDGGLKNYKQLDNGMFGQLIDNIFFPNSVAAPAYRFNKMHPKRVSEIAVEKVFETAYYPIKVTGHIDHLEGACIRDIKTKFRAVDFTEYEASCQWKFYLSLMELDVFYYDLFEIKGFDQFNGNGIEIMDKVEIIAHEPFQCLRYEAMEAEISTLLNDFIEYLLDRKSLHLIKPF